MSAQITRFSPPGVAEQNITRRALIKRLENLPRQCIQYIHAPAGYGKTTLAAQWLSEADGNSAWVTLDEYSASSSEVYSGILHALSCRADGEDAFVQVSLETMLDRLSSHTAWPCALVIDDFHLCADVGVVKALPMIRARLPSDMAFVVISRNPPHDVLGDEIVKGGVRQINNLQFDSHEISELFGKNQCSITKNHAKLLKERTDGWAAALSVILMAKNYEPYCGLLDQNTLNH